MEVYVHIFSLLIYRIDLYKTHSTIYFIVKNPKLALCSFPSPCFRSWTLKRAALHCPHFKIILLYLMLGCAAAPQFILSLKQAAFAPPPFSFPLIGWVWISGAWGFCAWVNIRDSPLSRSDTQAFRGGRNWGKGHFKGTQQMKAELEQIP